MKKVINGKVFDTETATELLSWGHGNIYDFRYIRETLYKTKKGKYFLYGVGGPLTSYAVRVSSSETSGSSNITHMTSKDALTWVEENFENVSDLILEEFSDLLELA
ncbi:MAG: hypothetical protein WC665_09735 [Sulfurimonas sp.]|jgi:hypothetical protein